MCTVCIVLLVVVVAAAVAAAGKTYKFRKGDRVGLCPPLWHRDAELYPDPLRFDPARWLLVGDAGKTEVGQVPSDEAAMAAQGRVQLSKGGKTLPR